MGECGGGLSSITVHCTGVEVKAKSSEGRLHKPYPLGNIDRESGFRYTERISIFFSTAEIRNYGSLGSI